MILGRIAQHVTEHDDPAPLPSPTHGTPDRDAVTKGHAAGRVFELKNRNVFVVGTGQADLVIGRSGGSCIGCSIAMSGARTSARR